MSHKVSLISLGCSKNLIDSEIMMGILNDNKCILTHDPKTADIIIVNTCGFINDAKEESIHTILKMGQYKNLYNCKYLIVAGCLSERYKEELMNEMPEIDALVGTGNIYDIKEVIENIMNGEKEIRVGNPNRPYDELIPRISSTPPHTAFLKIAEGCDNYCTYCIIPSLRGKYRSRKMEDIVKEARILATRGVKELILIAQDTTIYGKDIYDTMKLPRLLDELNKIDELVWIRVLYMYPDYFNDALINCYKRNNKVVNYVDIPIQHISNKILKSMNRKTSKETITTLITKIRQEIPDITIRTTIIVGFPGETENDFRELYDFISDMKFDRLGVFKYSQEEGTPAAKLKDQVDESIKEERYNTLMDLQRNISYNANMDKVDSIVKVLVEELVEDDHGYTYSGRTYMDSPDIDGMVYIRSQNELVIGDFVDVKIIDCLEYDLMGEIVDEFSK